MKELCKVINQKTGAEGKELMAYVFFIYAMYADLKGMKETEKHCSDRANECWKEHKERNIKP